MDKIDKNKLSNKNILEKLRKSRNLTQKQLADLIGISRTTITNYEKGTRKIPDHVSIALSKLFGVESLMNDSSLEQSEHIERLISYQEIKHLSNKQLAAQLDIDESLLSRLVHGKRAISETMAQKIEELILLTDSEILMQITQEDGNYIFPQVNKEELGNRIKSIRKDRDESLQTFGKNFTRVVGKNVVSRWEKGVNVPDIDRLMNIAYLGGTTVTYLMYGNIFREMLIKDKPCQKFPMLDRVLFGMRIRKIRKNLLMEREPFGQFFDPVITKWSMDKYENGKDIPNSERIIQYAYIGKVSLEFLVYGKS